MTGLVSAKPRRFPANTLPWIIAATALVLYAFTLNPWIAFANAEQVARLSGWLWKPELSTPLYFLVTLPIRALPEAWIPTALNVFSAACAAGVLALLARTVALLPYNRTHAQRIRAGSEGNISGFRWAWLPPIAAIALCGMQLTFWEHATLGTPVMLDLLVFAYVIRCLMEFRQDNRQRWLSQAAFLWGAGMANTYAMVGFFPLFMVALVWSKRMQFFEMRFLLRMTLWGLAGMSLYLLLPLWGLTNTSLPLEFWPSLKYTLLGQKGMLLGFPKKRLLLLSLISLFPILLIAIRWPKTFGDLNQAGEFFSKFFIHVLHGVFFVTCIWNAFDPPMSPRNIGRGLHFLSFYYLGAIAIGYFVGYFLLVFGHNPNAAQPGRRQRHKLSRKIIVATTWILCIGAPAGLLIRSLPQIQITNSSMLRDYTALTADTLPDGNTVVLTDDPKGEFFLKTILAQRGDRNDVIVLNTASLISPYYHQKMARQYPDRWPIPLSTNLTAQFTESALVSLMLNFANSNQVCYAHPSFGYYFEHFYTEPAGFLSILHPYRTGEVLPAPLSENVIQENLDFWNKNTARLFASVQSGMNFRQTKKNAPAGKTLLDKLHLLNEQNLTALTLGTGLSRALNTWSVTLQRSGHVAAAETFFMQASVLNPDNITAQVNLGFNAELQANRPVTLPASLSIKDAFITEALNKYAGNNRQKMSQVITDDGLFDEPAFTMAAAQFFQSGRLLHQAAREFDRVRTLVPNDLMAQIWFARLASFLGDTDQSLEIVQEIRNNPDRFPSTVNNPVELVVVETTAYLIREDEATAERLADDAIASALANTNTMASVPNMANNVIQLYLNARTFPAALRLINRQLESRPQNMKLLVNKGFVLIQLKHYAEAVETLSKALELQEGNTAARLNRAIANLQLKNLDEAQQDYEALLLVLTKPHPIYYGLGEIASQRKETNLAIHNFRLYLSNAPPNTVEARKVRNRLNALSGIAP